MLNFQAFKGEKIVIHTLPFKENPTSSLCGIFDVYSRNIDFSTFLRSVIITIFCKHLQYFINIYSILETQCNFYATFFNAKKPPFGGFSFYHFTSMFSQHQTLRKALVSVRMASLVCNCQWSTSTLLTWHRLHLLSMLYCLQLPSILHNRLHS